MLEDGIDLDRMRRSLIRDEFARQIEVLEDLMPGLYDCREAHVEAATAMARLRAAHLALGRSDEA